MKIPKLNREKNVSIEIANGEFLIRVDGENICRESIDKKEDIAILGSIFGELKRAEVLV